MNTRSSRFAALVAATAFALYAGTGIAQSAAEKTVPDVKLYNLGDPTTPRYDVVGRLPGDTSGWWVPTQPTREQAVAALQSEAARRGADGLVNVTCFDQGRQRWYSDPAPAFLCYGIAVRVRAAQASG